MSEQARGRRSYEEFLATIQPITIGLNRCSSFIDRKAYIASFEDEEGREAVVEVRPKSGELFDDAFDVQAEIRLRFHRPGDSAELLSVECEYVAHFHCDELRKELLQQYVDRFSESEFRLIIWPYFRELVTGMTGKMAVPPVVVPLVLRLDGRAERKKVVSKKGRKQKLAK